MQSKLKICNPKAGFCIALRCPVVIRGINTPPVVEEISNVAETLGLLVFIPIFTPVLYKVLLATQPMLPSYLKV